MGTVSRWRSGGVTWGNQEIVVPTSPGPPSASPTRDASDVCVAGTSGPNLLLSVLDLSQTGVRLILKNASAAGDALVLTLENALLPQPITVAGETMWSLPLTDGRYCVGVRFLQALTSTEVESLAYSYAGAPWLFPSTPHPAVVPAKNEQGS